MPARHILLLGPAFALLSACQGQGSVRARLKEVNAVNSCDCTTQNASTPVDLKANCCSDLSPHARKEPSREIEMEILYLDLNRCERCIGADATMTQAIDDARGVLAATGIEVSVRRTHVRSEEEAQRLSFVSSPTIRINGRDIAPVLEESPCSSCSCLSGSSVKCRSWSWRGEKHPVPPKGLILEALLRAAFATPRVEEPRTPPSLEVPENLKRFFEGRKVCCEMCCPAG